MKGRHCDYCAREFFPTPLHKYKLILKNVSCKWFCIYSCKQKFKKENPDIVRSDKRGRKKKKVD